MAVAQSTATELVHQIFDLQRVLRCLMAVHLPRGAGIGVALQGVLRFIGEGEARATHFAARLGVSAPVLSRHIAELEDMGLVARRPDPEDGRAQLIALTPAGASTLRALEDERSENLQRHLEGWSEEDAHEASRALGKLTVSLRESIRAMAAGANHTNATA